MLQEECIISLLYKIRTWSYKWLPIIMGCHCMPERSFFVKGRQLPVCARCEGILIGTAFAVIARIAVKINPFILVVLMTPLVLDGSIQKLTKYESNNWMRLITGILFGFSAVYLLLSSFVYVFMWGYHKGQSMV